MKALSISALLLLGGLSLFTACDDDRDSNPIIQHPDSFVLNEPSYQSMNVDLATSSTLALTYQQPDYGYTAVATYQAQVSLTGNFTVSADEAEEAEEAGNTSLVADYADVEGTSTLPTLEFTGEALARQLVRLGGWEEDNVPDVQNIYLRLRATVSAADTCYSNTVQLNVIPYYIELSNAPIEMWYLIGSCIGDGSWGSVVGTSLIPLSTVEGYAYDKKTGRGELTHTGYFTTEGFKLVRVPGAWDDQWGQGDSFGNFVKNDGGSGNITVPSNGYYTLTLDTRSDILTMTPADIAPTVYSNMLISGDFNGWATDQAMNPVNTAACMEGHNHVWTYTINATGGDTTCKFLQDGWSPNWGAANFPYGTGVNNGDNIPVTGGSTWVVTFNDIDGTYTFIAQ